MTIDQVLREYPGKHNKKLRKRLCKQIRLAQQGSKRKRRGGKKRKSSSTAIMKDEHDVFVERKTNNRNSNASNAAKDAAHHQDNDSREMMVPSAAPDVPVTKPSAEVIDLANENDDDDDDQNNNTKEEVIDLYQDESDNDDDAENDYQDLYEMDEANLKLPAKQKRPEETSFTTDKVDSSAPSAQQNDAPQAAEPVVSSDGGRSTSSLSSRQHVMEALEQAKQDLQRAQQLTTADRREVVRQTLARLKEAQRQFQAMRQRETTAVETTTLPPITALQQELVISNINNGPDELVRYHKAEHGDEFDTIRLQADEISASPENHQQKRLLLLKEKLSKLKSKQSKLRAAKKEEDDGEPDDTEKRSSAGDEDALLDDSSSLPRNDKSEPESTLKMTNGNFASLDKDKDPIEEPASNKRVVLLQSKEDLMKRQEELQAKMDVVQTKRLLTKQKKLLEEQQHKLQGIEQELQECRDAVEQESKGLQECNDVIVRWPILEDMIANATRQVLSTRKALREAKAENEQESRFMDAE